MSRVRSRVPMVAGLAYRERLAKVPTEFTATLKPEPGKPYHPSAIAVYSGDEKIGYVAPEVARVCYERVADSGSASCPGYRTPGSSVATGVEARLDLSDLLSG